MPSSSALAACVVLLATCASHFAAAAGPQTAAQRTPSVNGLTESQQIYQLSVWAFIVFLVIGVMGFGTMLSINYDDDAVLNSDPVHHATAKAE